MDEKEIPVFAINLERSVERRTKLAAAFEAIGVSVRFHAAVDGSASDLRESPLYDRALRNARYGVDMTSREIACYLSHLAVMRHCLDEGIARAIILEDDVRPEPLFARVLQALARAPDCFEFVRLYGLRERASLDVCPLAEGVRLVWPTHGLCGAQGYYLTANAMRKILASGKVTLPYDVMLDRFWRYGAAIFATEPYVLRLAEAQPSDIGQRTDVWADGSHRGLRLRLKALKLAERIARTRANLACRLALPQWRRDGEAAFGAHAEAPSAGA